MESIFNIFLDQTLFEDPYYSSIIIPASPFFCDSRIYCWLRFNI